MKIFLSALLLSTVFFMLFVNCSAPKNFTEEEKKELSDTLYKTFTLNGMDISKLAEITFKKGNDLSVNDSDG